MKQVTQVQVMIAGSLLATLGSAFGLLSHASDQVAPATSLAQTMSPSLVFSSADSTFKVLFDMGSSSLLRVWPTNDEEPATNDLFILSLLTHSTRGISADGYLCKDAATNKILSLTATDPCHAHWLPTSPPKFAHICVYDRPRLVRASTRPWEWTCKGCPFYFAARDVDKFPVDWSHMNLQPTAASLVTNNLVVLAVFSQPISGATGIWPPPRDAFTLKKSELLATNAAHMFQQ